LLIAQSLFVEETAAAAIGNTKATAAKHQTLKKGSELQRNRKRK
jgi:hypothetical protein